MDPESEEGMELTEIRGSATEQTHEFATLPETPGRAGQGRADTPPGQARDGTSGEGHEHHEGADPNHRASTVAAAAC